MILNKTVLQPLHIILVETRGIFNSGRTAFAVVENCLHFDGPHFAIRIRKQLAQKGKIVKQTKKAVGSNYKKEMERPQRAVSLMICIEYIELVCRFDQSAHAQ